VNSPQLVKIQRHRDSRGHFEEIWKDSLLRADKVEERFVQTNYSLSKPGVLRGLHYQGKQGKLLYLARGNIWDVAVDLRRNSRTFGRYFNYQLSSEAPAALWIPPGFAHGFLNVGNEDALVIYLVTEEYDPKAEGGIRWDDPRIAIPWPIPQLQISERDRNLPYFDPAALYF
jgi:dTDP-4-dehydrorhamnose 3,5-epimerase